MHTRFHLAKRNSYPWVFLFLVIILVVGIYFAGNHFPKIQDKVIDLLLPLTAAVGGFVHFLYAQHHQNTLMFVNLFKEFNERYDKLNEKLNAIVIRESECLTENDQKVLFDYFNLCAEEYIFYKAGYIDEEIWQSWVAGMKYFARKKPIYILWEAELKHGSYYCFSIKLLDSNSTVRKCDRCGRMV